MMHLLTPADLDTLMEARCLLDQGLRMCEPETLRQAAEIFTALDFPGFAKLATEEAAPIVQPARYAASE